LDVPKISVILPVYNGSAYICESIDSILKQHFADFELIIVNDASSDNCKELINQYTDSRINYIEHAKNEGLVAALNTGILLARGKYIARMDQDDISMPNRLQLQFDFMEKNENCVLLGTQIQILDGIKSSKMFCGSEDLKSSLLFGTSFAHPSVMMRASVLRRSELFYEERFKHAEDYGLWTLLALHGAIENLPDICLKYRKHHSQYTKVFSNEMIQASRYIRNNYLKACGVSMGENDLETLNMIAEKSANIADESVIEKIGCFLERLSTICAGSRFNADSLKKVSYIQWRQLCGERQKKGYGTYGLYKKFHFRHSIKDLRTHAWFFRHIFFKKNNMYSV